MKLSRMLVILATVLFLGALSFGSAEAAWRTSPVQITSWASSVVNGFSLHWTDVLKLWKSGHRYFLD